MGGAGHCGMCSFHHANGGELRLNAQQDFNAAGVGDFRLGLHSDLNPETLAPLLEAKFKEGAKKLAQFKFHEAPKISLSARGPSPLDCAASGELTLGRTSYRNVEALGARANLRYNGRVLSIDDFTLRREEGVGGGSIAFDLARTWWTSKVCVVRYIPSKPRCGSIPTWSVTSVRTACRSSRRIS
jgi:hypothetical protein